MLIKKVRIRDHVILAIRVLLPVLNLHEDNRDNVRTNSL